MMKQLLFGLGFCLAITGAASAQMGSYEFASNLGLVLASEGPCDLTFEDDAIAAYIEANVAAEDMEFAEFLAGTTTLGGFKIEQMNGTQLKAHCTQIRRAASAHHLIVAPATSEVPFVIGEPIYTKPRP